MSEPAAPTDDLDDVPEELRDDPIFVLWRTKTPEQERMFRELDAADAADEASTAAK